MKQTAIEWLVEQLRKPNTDSYISKIIEQALAMEKEQIIDAWDDGIDSFSSRTAEQYYSENYGK